jgi:hypothetical protein
MTKLFCTTHRRWFAEDDVCPQCEPMNGDEQFAGSADRGGSLYTPPNKDGFNARNIAPSEIPHSPTILRPCSVPTEPVMKTPRDNTGEARGALSDAVNVGCVPPGQRPCGGRNLFAGDVGKLSSKENERTHKSSCVTTSDEDVAKGQASPDAPQFAGGRTNVIHGVAPGRNRAACIPFPVSVPTELAVACQWGAMAGEAREGTIRSYRIGNAGNGHSRGGNPSTAAARSSHTRISTTEPPPVLTEVREPAAPARAAQSTTICRHGAGEMKRNQTKPKGEPK